MAVFSSRLSNRHRRCLKRPGDQVLTVKPCRGPSAMFVRPHGSSTDSHQRSKLPRVPHARQVRARHSRSPTTPNEGHAALSGRCPLYPDSAVNKRHDAARASTRKPLCNHLLTALQIAVESSVHQNWSRNASLSQVAPTTHHVGPARVGRPETTRPRWMFKCPTSTQRCGV